MPPTSSASAKILYGQTFHWASWDAHSAVATAAVHGMLKDYLAGQAVRVVLHRAEQPSELVRITSEQPLALAFWSFDESKTSTTPSGSINQLHKAICESIAAVREIDQDLACVCLVEPYLVDAGLLTEAGAQVVVSRIPSLQGVLQRIVASAPLSQHGFHPITSGLVDRLPWKVQTTETPTSRELRV